MSEISYLADYSKWISTVKSRIQSAQIKAALSVNSELIHLYWELGREIAEKQEKQKWGNSVLEQISKDLKQEFPHLGGFSRTNLYYMRQFFLFYKDISESIVHQAGGQIPETVLESLKKIPWKHNVLIFSKSKKAEEAVFYINSVLENNCSRKVMNIQIESRLYKRQGKAVTNFERTLPKPQSGTCRSMQEK